MSARLVVLRHAKSDWPVGTADLERPLGRRGRRDAVAAGRWLAAHNRTPDLVWCSPSRRTRETWGLVAEALASTPEVRLDERVYEASTDDLVAVLRDTPDRADMVLLVGHNPGVQDLVLSLAGEADEEARALAETKFPTCGLAELQLRKRWRDLSPGGARLREFVVPRG